MANWNIKEGSIAFRVKKEKLDWADGLMHVLLNLSNEAGSLFLEKDSDNKLKFSIVILGKGRTDVEKDVYQLSKNVDHHIAITWSLKNKEICLYIDGEIAAKTPILYA
jgi:hypothetical protein